MTIEIVRPAGVCTVQDLGRRGHMHEAVPPGGALVPELLVAANRRVRNPDGAPAIEVLGRLTIRVPVTSGVSGGAIEVATDRDGPRVLRAGEELVVESEPRRAAYLAVRGGLDVPWVLDGRGTLLCAALGRRLAKGDLLRLAFEPEVAQPQQVLDEGDVITVIAGPDLDAFRSDALERLASTTWHIASTSDRVGTRLGAAPAEALHRIDGYRERSRPMVIGALEVPRDGMPLVLGPEHPTTGGYPVIGVIASAELGRFFAIRLGGTVRFRVAR